MMKVSIKLWTGWVAIVLVFSNPDFSKAESLKKSSWTKKLNSRLLYIKKGWEREFNLSKPAHILASIQLSSDTDWEDPANSASVVAVAVDGRLLSHIVTYFGRKFHSYNISLGLIPPGKHYLEILRADSSKFDIKLMDIRLEGYESKHPDYPILDHAPLIFGREDMRRSDVPLILAYKLEYFEQENDRTNHKPKAIEYTVVYSNETGGTEPVELLHRWGRYTDIELAYRVELDTLGNRVRSFYQGANHDTLIFRGGFENNQPTLQVATLNNMLSDSLTTKLRFALAPSLKMPANGLREELMLNAPWTWTISAGEAYRERRYTLPAELAASFGDLHNYLFIQFTAEPRFGNEECGGFFVAKFRNQAGEYTSHLWREELVIRSNQPFQRQTAIPLPSGASAGDLIRVDFIAASNSNEIVLTDIFKMFSLDENGLPRLWKPSWNGRADLRAGERVRFFIDGFEMRKTRIQELANEWHFKIDPWEQGSVDSWAAHHIHEHLWPKIQIGKSWHEQNYTGYDGVAWYRTQFLVDKDWRGERLWLNIGQIDDDFEVWLNKKYVIGSNKKESSLFKYHNVADITPDIKFGESNSLVVRVSGRNGSAGNIAGTIGLSNVQDAIILETEQPVSDSLVFTFAVDSLAQSFRNYYHPPERADLEQSGMSLRDRWNDFLQQGTVIDLPEERVNRFVKSALIYNTITYNEQAGQTKPNKLFTQTSIASIADAARAFDLMGHHVIAGKLLHRLLEKQNEKIGLDPDFKRTQSSMPADNCAVENSANVLWAIRQHVELNQDSSFSKNVFPFVSATIQKLDRFQNKNSTLPVNPHLSKHTCLYDSISADIFSLMCLKDAIAIAKLSSQPNEIERWGLIYAKRRQFFLHKLEGIRFTPKGWNLPRLGNGADLSQLSSLLLAYPSELLEPNDEKVTRITSLARGKFEKGLFTRDEGKWLDPILTTNITHTSLLQGKARNVVHDFYALLLHVNADYSFARTQFFSWRDQEPNDSLLVGNQVGSRIITLLHDMLIRAEGRHVHLFNAVSPAWFKPGGKIQIDRIKTKFGELSFKATIHSDGLTLDLFPNWKTVPQGLILHAPFFTELLSIQVDNFESSFENGQVKISPYAREVHIKWKNWAERTNLSFESSMDDFKREHFARYDLWKLQQHY